MRRTCWALAALVLTACGTSPESRYYLPEPPPPTSTITAGPVIFVDEVSVATYADRPQFVTRVADVRVVHEEFDVWAEPVRALVTGYLVDALGNVFGRANVLETPPGRPFDADYRVRVDVHRLDATEDGTVVLDAAWVVFAGSDERLRERDRRRFTTMLPAEAGDAATGNQDARALAIADLLDRLAATIAASIP